MCQAGPETMYAPMAWRLGRTDSRGSRTRYGCRAGRDGQPPIEALARYSPLAQDVMP
jgi:hypothetical protein